MGHETWGETGTIMRVMALAVIFGLAHWFFVKMAIEDLIVRPRVIGGRKAPWALAIIFITCLGSFLYLMIHPELQAERDERLGRTYPRKVN